MILLDVDNKCVSFSTSQIIISPRQVLANARSRDTVP
jgi:hypothetical protein